MAIQLFRYRNAVNHLIANGSVTAALVHVPHGGGINSVPDGYGLALLRQARDSFNGLGGAARIAGRAAVVTAAGLMGIAHW